jgi:hypothetical protein
MQPPALPSLREIEGVGAEAPVVCPREAGAGLGRWGFDRLGEMCEGDHRGCGGYQKH